MTLASNIPPLRSRDFEKQVLGSPDLVVVEFGTGWLGGSHIMSAVLEPMAIEFAGRIRFRKVDGEADPEFLQSFGINSLPVLLFFQDGECIDRLEGVVPRSLLRDKMNSLLEEKLKTKN